MQVFYIVNNTNAGRYLIVRCRLDTSLVSILKFFDKLFLGNRYLK